MPIVFLYYAYKKRNKCREKGVKLRQSILSTMRCHRNESFLRGGYFKERRETFVHKSFPPENLNRVALLQIHYRRTFQQHQ